MDDDLQTYRFGLKPFISAFIQHFSDIVAVNLLMSLTFLTIVGIPSAFVTGAAGDEYSEPGMDLVLSILVEM